MKRNSIFFLLQVICVGFLSSTFAFSQSENLSKTVYLRVNVIDDKGRFIGGLKKENFTVKEDKIEQELSYFSDEDEPASVAILLDISGSIKTSMRKSAVRSVLKFGQASNILNDYSLIAFGEQIYPLTDWGSTDKQILQVLEMLTIEKPKFQETNLWDACIYALSKLEKAKYQKRILLIYSDGMNNVHENSFKKVRERLKESDALVYFVGLIDGKDQNSIMSFQGQSFLSALSFISGGSGFFPQNQKEIDEITERIALTIRRQYVIGYAPKENTKKEKWRNVIVKSAALSEKGKKVSFSVIAREGYFVK